MWQAHELERMRDAGTFRRPPTTEEAINQVEGG